MAWRSSRSHPGSGGALTDTLGWESVFFLNLPVGAAAIVATLLKVRESRDPNATRVDWAGLVTFSASLFMLVLALLRGNEEGWGSAMIVGLLVGAAVLMALFLATETRVNEPMLPLGLFKIRSFTGGGCSWPPLPSRGVALSTVPDEQSGMATGINDTFRQVGVAVGIAAWGAVFLARGESKLTDLAAGTPAAAGERPRELIEATSSGNLERALEGVPASARETVETAAREGFLSGFNEILVLGGGLSFAGALLALWLVRQGDMRRPDPETALEAL